MIPGSQKKVAHLERLQYLYAYIYMVMEKKKVYDTFINVERPTFWKGIGSILNLSGKNFKHKYGFKSINQSIKIDAESLRSDWEMIGNDIQKGIAEVVK